MFKFEVLAQDKKARVGKLTTPHGIVETPVFLPVGTQASVKSLDSQDLKDLGIQMILANTYHLYLRPGADTVSKLGGLYKFMDWDRPILTDSGGFQVFSLGFGIEHEVGKMTPLFAGEIADSQTKTLVARTKLCKIEEEGATFQSHLDGSLHFFSPEISVETQIKLGADFMVAMDECTSPLHDYEYTKISMERSHRWEKRSLEYLFRHPGGRRPIGSSKKDSISRFAPSRMTQQIFGVVQGGPFKDLRIESAKFVSKNDFFGVGIGGALVSKKQMHQILDWINPYLDPAKPRHLLGIGAVDDIFEAVERGVDIFDCVLPTRLARSGFLLPNIDINKVTYKEDKTLVWQNYTRAYLHHLFRTRELLAYRLATLYNLNYMNNLMAQIRESIAQRKFAKMKEKWLTTPTTTGSRPTLS